MSQWTHITGSISCDSLMSVISGNDPIDLAKKSVGNWADEWAQESDIGSLDEDDTFNKSDYDIPAGSEGPLCCQAFRIGGHSSSNNLLISYWGNLRDFGEPEVQQDLIPYFKNLIVKLKNNGISIRNMAIEIDVEYGNRYLLTVDRMGYTEQFLKVVNIRDKEEIKKATTKSIIDELLTRQEEIPLEFQETFKKHFWDILA